MAQLRSDKYNIAWFKLAEMVSRREKERALGLFRLLVHSLPDDAFAEQLRGDLLHAFDDQKAIQSYIKAAELYEQSGRIAQAVAVYEHCRTLVPSEMQFLTHLIRLYGDLGLTQQIERTLATFVTACCNKKSYKKAIHAVTQSDISDSLRVELHSTILCEMVRDDTFDGQNVPEALPMLLDVYTDQDNARLSALLSRLEFSNGAAYQWAVSYISQTNA